MGLKIYFSIMYHTICPYNVSLTITKYSNSLFSNVPDGLEKKFAEYYIYIYCIILS
jgi:hypothetical protein